MVLELPKLVFKGLIILTLFLLGKFLLLAIVIPVFPFITGSIIGAVIALAIAIPLIFFGIIPLAKLLIGVLKA